MSEIHKNQENDLKSHYIPSESLSTQHKLLVMGLEIKKGRKNRGRKEQPRIRWGQLTMTIAFEIGKNLMS